MTQSSKTPPPIKRPPTLPDALIPVAALIVLLVGSVYLYGSDSSGGPNQIALMLAASVAVLVGLKNGYNWKEIESGIVHGISLSMGAILILLVVGSLIGTWILSGVVPTMIYYGLLILHPSIFYAAAAVISAIIALATGSSWTTVSTIGIALVGVATAQDLNLGLTAGAIISGAYFGDKMSPLSDTTNLAPAMAGTDLFTHIRHMVWTTTPSIVIAVVLFAVIGWFEVVPGERPDVSAMLQTLDGNFTIHWFLLSAPALVVALALRRMPALPAILIGALFGGVLAAIFQRTTVVAYVADPALSTGVALLKGIWTALFAGYALQSGNEAIDSLLSRGGMASMLPVVWLVLCAMVFGAVMETTGSLQRLAQAILGFVKGTGSLIAATIFTSIGMNIIASDQYISIVLPGRMFRAEYRRRKLHPKNLSRTLEDAGTLTSPLVPWNTCGAFMASTLGVPTLVYLPYAFFNLINPVVAAIYGFTNFTIEPADEEEAEREAA